MTGGAARPDSAGRPAAVLDAWPEDELAEELSEGALDPDEVDPLLDPWDDGADDET